MAGAERDRLHIEVAYGAAPDEVVVIALQLEAGATAEQAIRRSGILERFPGIDLEQDRIGIFGKAVARTAVLEDGDRVEIYRPLRADPKETRRRRAARRRERG